MKTAMLDAGPWLRVGRVADIPLMEGRSVTVEGERVAIFHTEAGFFAIGGDCPHSGGPLADGIVGERCVSCPLHNWRVDLATGKVIAGGEGSVEVYDVAELGGELYLRPAQEAAA